MLSLLKSKLLGIGAAVIAALLALVSVLASRNRRLRVEYKAIKKNLEFREDIEEEDSEIEQRFSHRAEEARRDLDEGKIPEHLSKPPRI